MFFFADFIATSFTIFIGIAITLTISIQLVDGKFLPYRIFGFMNTLVEDHEQIRNMKFFFLRIDEVKIPFYCMILTSYLTSIWIWFYFIGIFSIRFINISEKMMKFAQYTLPIQEKPMRSIGIVVAPLAGLGTWLATFV